MQCLQSLPQNLPSMANCVPPGSAGRVAPSGSQEFIAPARPAFAAMRLPMKDAMPAVPWPAAEPACYGVVCNLHHTCARYAAVEGNTTHGQRFVGTCGPTRPGFQPVGWHPQQQAEQQQGGGAQCQPE